MNKNNRFKTTDMLEGVVKKSVLDKVLIKDIILSMDASGFGLIIILFTIPIIIPVLPPPIPSLLSLPLFIFSLQMMFGFDAPKLPKIIANRSIKRITLANIVEKISPYLKKIEKLVKPRLSFLASGACERVIGFLIFLLSISILIPLPLTSFIPALGIFIISFGLIGRDGVMILIGIFIGCIGASITLMVFLLGAEVISIIIKKIFFMLTF